MNPAIAALILAYCVQPLPGHTPAICIKVLYQCTKAESKNTAFDVPTTKDEVVVDSFFKCIETTRDKR
jgi:hypothetical protein